MIKKTSAELIFSLSNKFYNLVTRSLLAINKTILLNHYYNYNLNNFWHQKAGMYRGIISLVLVFSITILKAQGPGELLTKNKEDNLIIKGWSVENELISNSIRKIGKNHDGFLFIVTYNGIAFFDGKNFENFTTDNVKALKTNNIYDFCIDQDSIFWIATYRGVLAFDGKRFYVPEKFKEIENLNVQTINIDKTGTLWIGTISDGLYRCKNEKLEKVTQVKALDKSIISMLFPDNKGNMWIGTEQGELYKYDGVNYNSLIHTRVNNGVLAGIQDKSGKYYFGTRNGLYTYANDSVFLISDQINYINDLRIDKNGQLWIATNSGLYFFNTTTGKFFPILSNSGLNKQIIQTVYFDTDDVIWIGTYRRGLMQLRIGAFQNSLMSSRKINETPSALAEISDNTIWVGTDEGNVYELVNGDYKQVHFKSTFNNGRIKSIFIDSEKTKWICSYNGLLRIKNGTEKLLNTSSGFPDNTIRGIVETQNGNYWVSTRQSGVYKINRGLEIIKTINTNNGLSSNFAMAIVKGKNGKIFVATKSGLDILKNDKIIKHYGTQNGLAEEIVFNVNEDNNGIIWVATIGGLTMIDGDKTTSFNKKTGLDNEKIFDVLEDNEGFMWFPTTNGIIRVKKTELLRYASGAISSIHSVIFDKSDGIYNHQYVSASKGLRMNNGNIAFNTIAGVTILNSKIANSVSSKQLLLIKGISTETNTYRNNNEELVLPPSSKYLQIDYSYIDFINPDKVEFNYKLEPFDVEWQKSGTERFAKYTNLPPGDYIFKVKAIVKSQEKKELIKEISFKIMPAFYESLLFKIITVVVLVLSIWFIYVLRVRTIKHQKEQLEKEVTERTAEISDQKAAIEENIEKLEIQKSEIAEKNEEILVARNKIEQAYINLKLLSDLGKEITSSLSEEDIIMIVYQNVKLIMDADLVAIGSLNNETNSIHFKSTIYKGRKMNEYSTEMDPIKSIICYAIENEKAIISNNMSQDYPSFKECFSEIKTLKPFTSVIVLPFRSKEGVTGVLTAKSFRKNSYSDYHFTLMASLAVYVGIAIENTKAYQKIQNQKDELQKVNAAKDRMFSIIGHDLRSPVGTIKSFLDVIIENPEITDTENTLLIFKTMQQSLGSAYSLLDNLLLWARSQRDQVEYEPANFSIIEPIKESINLVTESAKNKDISIETKIDSDLNVHADKNMITTVLRNLISNAIKFTNKNGQIKIESSLETKKINGKLKKLVQIKVIDSGIGISKENIEKILTVNEIYSTPGTNKEQGSGLGIGICIDFLKKHKQNLYVENNKETSNTDGTTFIFYLEASSKKQIRYPNPS